MGPKIEKAAYKQGREFFRNGKTIKELVENMQAAEVASRALPAEQREAAEGREFSIIIGFADAVLDQLRGIKR